MGAVVSCIQSCFRAIGQVLMAIVHGVGSIIMAIVNGIIALFDIIIGCLTCNYAGRRRHRVGGSRRSHHRTTAAI